MVNMQHNRTKMKTVESSIRKNNFNKIFLGYTEEEALNEASRCLHCPKPKCMEGCPINNKIPLFLEEVKNKNYEGAYKLILENSILPDICGTICPHEDQCEGHCIRGIKQEGVRIGAVERFVSEWANKNIKKVTPIKNNHKVACIGSGPASLAFALYCSRNGYQVDIYEKDSFLGGVLSWGIPSFRLDREIIKNYFDELKNNGSNFYLNHKFDESNPLNNIIDKYDGIFIGVGAPKNNKMRIPGEELLGVYSAEDFLRKINLSQLDKDNRREFLECGEKVIVVGGGNVAMDAARCAIRLKQVKSVKILYRRSENEMPACKEELDQAKEEGIEFICLTNPVAFLGNDNKLNKAECAKMILGEPDESGRRRPIESNEPHIFFDVDTLVCALGFSTDGNIYKSIPNLNIDKWGCPIVDSNNMTSITNIYSGGDCVTGAKTVVLAMKAGINAAKHLDSKLKSIK